MTLLQWLWYLDGSISFLLAVPKRSWAALSLQPVKLAFQGRAFCWQEEKGQWKVKNMPGAPELGRAAALGARGSVQMYFPGECPSKDVAGMPLQSLNDLP